jgi:nucleotide-binding universal stress UspA family protein
MEFQRILFPVDFSKSCEQVVPWVHELIERTGASLNLLHVWDSPPEESAGIDSGVFKEMGELRLLECRYRRRVEAFRTKYFAFIQTEAWLLSGDPAEQIASFARTAASDLIMMATHGYGPIHLALLGSVTANVIRDSLCPVWTMAQVEELPDAPYPCRLIMCAVDYAEESVKTMQHASLLARDLGCSLIIVSAVSSVDQVTKVAEHIEACGRLAQVNAPVCVDKGAIETVVPRIARRYGANLIVVGRGRTAEFLGTSRSHVYRIIRNSPCPVLAI